MLGKSWEPLEASECIEYRSTLRGMLQKRTPNSRAHLLNLLRRVSRAATSDLRAGTPRDAKGYGKDMS